MIQQMIGLQLKVQKHLDADLDKAAYYLGALLQRDGAPEPGSAEKSALEALKRAGFRFINHPESGVIVVKRNGRVWYGREALADWNAKFQSACW